MSNTPVLFGHDLSGPTSARPTNCEPGQWFFDTTKGAAVWWNGSAWVLGLIAAPPAAQVIQNPTANGNTNLTIAGGAGTGNGTLQVKDGSGNTIVTLSSNGGIQLAQGTGVSLDGGAFASDGGGNVSMLSASLTGGFLSLLSQTIAVTASTPITSSNVICTGTTTAPKLPLPSAGTVIYVKNLGTGNCVVAADAGSDINALNSGTGASSLTIATLHSAILIADESHWNQLA
ncbi:MAG TPA: hypothetical protein VGG64_21050 [Pirellulales bacterium]|jgi:hypothetical protein